MARLVAMFNVLEEANRADIRQRRNLQRMHRYNTNSMNMDCEEFRRNYRLTKDLFSALLQDISPFMKPQTRKSDISIKCKLLVTLSFYATGSYQRLVGRSTSTFMSQQSVSKAIREVTDALCNARILSKYIKFPGSAEERNLIKTRFYEKFQIPGVLGCIDGTHVAIIRPSLNEERYFNRKHYHSRNVQIICDSDLNILSVDGTFGGATHDSFIFSQHPIKAHLIDLISRGETTYLLGDSGYAQREYLMTPIVNAAAGSPEDFYTKKHCSARNTVERTIGLLKARWRCLLRHRVLHYNPQMATKIINACCVLHNICNASNLPAPDAPDAQEEAAATDVREDDSSVSSRNDELRQGQAARQRLVQNLWRSRQQR